MTVSTFIGLINNAALLVSLVLIYDLVVLRQSGEKVSLKQIPIGLILGVIGLAIMKNTWEFLPGIIFDTRSILLSVCGLFFGMVPTVTTIILTGGYRLYLGGAGAWTGFSVIVISGAVGLGWRHFMTNDLDSISNKNLFLMGFVTHILMLLLMLTLPRAVAFGVLSKITLPVILIFPLGTVLLGRLFINRRNRIKSEQLQKESEQRFQRAMNASQDGVYDWDLETKEIYYSPGWKRMLGYEPDELPNNFSIWEELTHPDDVKASWTMMNEVIEGKRDRFEIEFRMKHKNGHWVDILSRSNLYKDDLSDKVRVVGTHVDISEIKKVERELKAKQEEHGLILETAMDGFWIVDTAGRFLEVNETYCEMSGYAEQELLRMDISALEDVEKAADISAHMRKVLAEGQDLFESRHRRKDGGVFDVEVSVQYQPLDKPQCVVFIRDITERKRAEEELKKFKIISDHAVYGKAIADLQGNLLYINHFFAEIHGYNSEELIGKHLSLFHSPEQMEVVDNLNTSMIREGHFTPTTVWHRHKDGTEFPMLMSGVLITDDGAPQCIAASAIDMTIQHQAGKAMRESEGKHSALIEGMPDTVMRFDREGRHLFVSDNVRKTVDIEPERFIGKTHAELGFPEEQCRFWEESIRRVFDSDAPFETEFTFEGKAGPVIFDWRIFPERDAQGAMSSVLSITRDITAHRKAEQEYQTLFREMLDGFALHEIILDVDGTPVDYRFLVINPAFERMTGLKAGDIVGRSVLEVLPFTERHWIETYGKVALTGEPVHFESYSIEIGKHFEVTSFRPVEGQFACIFQDITERKKAEAERERLQAQLTQVQKMESIGNLAGGIAHDFNNILFPIVGMSELLLEDLPPGSNERENAEEIFKAGKRGSDLVKQILAFSRQSEHKMMPTRIQNILKEVIKLSRSTIPTYIDMKQDIQQDCGMVLADQSQIHQIGMNLITNAYHAVEEKGGKIFIRLKQALINDTESLKINLSQGEYVVLSILDTGHGMSEEILGKIFDPYFTTKAQGKGTGLGLAVVYGIVKGHQGDIKVYSEIGKGSTFDIYLPLMKKNDRIESVHIPEAYRGGDERILLVDDEESVAKLEKQMLERMGYKVTCRLHSAEALEVFRASPFSFDLVVSDMSMPNIPGDELAKKIKSIRSDVPIIICTGFSERIHEDSIRQMGIDALLMKPVVISELAKTVRKMLDEPKKSLMKFEIKKR